MIADYPPPPHFGETTGLYTEERLRELQEERLRARVAEAWDTSFYAARWGKAGLSPGDIKGLDDLDLIPPITSDDLRAAIDEAPPFGSHHPIGSDDLGRMPIKIATSGGTTGPPRITLFDPIAWEVQGIQYARAMYAQGGRPGDVVQIPFTAALANLGWAAFTGVFHWLGGVPLTTGSGLVTSTERQLDYARGLGTTGWVAAGDYMGRLAQHAADNGIELRHDVRTRWIHTYLGADTEGRLRKALEDAWGAPVYDNYGTHEIGLIGFECEARDRLHLNEDTVIVQVVDVDHGRLLSYGQQGDLVATSLHRTVPPFIRYNLRDTLVSYPREQCACGLRTAKLSGFLGRSDQMIKLRGQNLYPEAVGDILAPSDLVTGEYLCVLSRRGASLAARTELTVRVERRDQTVDAHALRRDLGAEIRSRFGVRVEVEIVAPGSLAPLTGATGDGKTKRVVWSDP